jgi:hypothetical protein
MEHTPPDDEKHRRRLLYAKHYLLFVVGFDCMLARAFCQSFGMAACLGYNPVRKSVREPIGRAMVSGGPG